LDSPLGWENCPLRRPRSGRQKGSRVLEWLELVVSLGGILFSAELFTNGVE
jgi:hypothetical protein